MGLDEYAWDPRFTSAVAMTEHADAAYRIVADAIATSTFAECKWMLSHASGEWAPVQDAWELAHDEGLTANGRIAIVVDAEGGLRQLVAGPVKFDDHSDELRRAPRFGEDTDEVLSELGADGDRLIELKLAGAITQWEPTRAPGGR